MCPIPTVGLTARLMPCQVADMYQNQAIHSVANGTSTAAEDY